MPTTLNGVSFGNGAYVAVGEQDTIIISTNNGLQWSCRAFSDVVWGSNTSQQGGPFQCAYGNGTFVIGGTYYVPFFTSPDGVNWTAQWPSQFIGADNSYCQSLSFVHGLFVAVEYDGVYVSTDGVTWTLTLSQSISYGGVAYGNNTFVLVEAPTINNVQQLFVFTSPNATNWTARTLGANIGDYNYIAFGNGKFVVPVAYSTNYGFLTSTNGINWNTNLVDNAVFVKVGYHGNSLAFGNGVFLMVPLQTGNVLTSSDGANWQSHPSPTGYGTQAGNVAFGNGEFILSSTNGIATSVDGVSWVNHNLTRTFEELFNPAYSWLNSIAFGHDIFVGATITSFGGTVVSSSRLENPQLAGSELFSNGTFQMTIVGQMGHSYAVAASTNFTSWSSLTNLIGTNAPIDVIDPETSNFNYRFYRAVED
jgi:hypothetical protein